MRRAVQRCRRSACRRRLCRAVFAVLSDAADAVLVAHQVYPATIAGNPKA
jgi:hypothetical protein